MKITTLAIIVAIILTPASLFIDFSQRRQLQAHEIRTRYNEIMQMATEDATLQLITQKSNVSIENIFEGYTKDSKDVDPNLNAALEAFYSTLFMNFGVEDDEVAQDGIKAFVPIKMVVAYDGFYVHTAETFYNEDKGKNETAEIWIPKKAYSYYDPVYNIVINFTLSDYAFVYSITDGCWYEGKREELFVRYPGVNSVFYTSIFDTLRRETIVRSIQEDLEYYTSRNNYIAKMLNKSLVYNIPYISNETWNNTIDDICFIAFMQGMPLSGVTDNYNTYGFGGTRLKLTSKVYANTVGGVKYYYPPNVVPLTVERVFNNRKEAAKEGYRPAP